MAIIRSFGPIAIFGIGLYFSAAFIPGLWTFIFIVGLCVGFFAPLILSYLPEPAGPSVPAHERVEFSRTQMYGIATVLAISACFLFWLVYRNGDFFKLPMGMASCLQYTLAVLLGLAGAVATITRFKTRK